MNDLTRKTVDLSDGTKLEVVTRPGDRAGPVLLYIHGLGGLDEDLAMLRQLPGDVIVHAPDLKGFRCMDDVPRVQRQCSELITALELARPMLAGHGAGAAVAAELEAASPHGFAHLFLVAPQGMDADQRPVSGEGMGHRLAYIDARTTLIRGKQDATVTAAAILDLARLLPRSALVTVPEAGNDVIVTRPDAVARGFRHGMRVSGVPD